MITAHQSPPADRPAGEGAVIDGSKQMKQFFKDLIDAIA